MATRFNGGGSKSSCRAISWLQDLVVDEARVS